VQILSTKAEVKGPIVDAWNRALSQLEGWIRQDLLHALIYGGFGIEGIAQTAFYRWVTSSAGLSELGIPPTEPPKLLEAYRASFKIDVKGSSLLFQFGNVASLIKGTPHPADGTGKLKIRSWMRWITSSEGGPGLPVTDAGFVPRARLNSTSQKSIRLNSPLGGLMLSKGRVGSAGTWEADESAKNYDEVWFAKNQDKIAIAINDRMAELFAGALLNG
jgi:hypothetical protein